VTACNLCGVPAVELLIDFDAHPIAHRLPADPLEPEYTHPVLLGFCGECGLTQLIGPIPPEELYTNYNWLSAWKFNPHVPRLIELLDGLPGLERAEARVLEVGSNDGSFLAELQERGYSKVLGLEPALDAVTAARERGVPTLHEYLTLDSARRIRAEHGPFDLLILRQVIEHISGLQEVAAAMTELIEPGGYVLVEVPDFGFNQSAPDYSAIWEEHVNHFTSETLGRFLATAGVEVLHHETARFSGQILIALGQRRAAPVDVEVPVRDLRDRAFGFRDRWPSFRHDLEEYLAGLREQRRPIAIYGAGCRSSCLVNYAEVADLIDMVVDDQPEKQGRVMPGSRLPIVPSTALEEQRVGVCLLAVNAENEDKVIARHASYTARGGEFMSIHPPSPRLPRFWTRLR
jgi:SAM-dependent methyltransferase